MIASVVEITRLVALPVLGLSALLSAWCILRGPTIADRIVGLELLTTIGVGIAACVSIVHGQSALLDVSLVLALVAFLATVAYARALGDR
ncbi:MAG: monovalent cation/H+ antiporter complex subunit F [Planctomycetota bacterium]|nr:monovalent cation/H+ antiporter complex subunit F [Planctomycetota bacterium]